MDFSIKNKNFDFMRIFIEPSADELILQLNDVLSISVSGENLPPLEIHPKDGKLVLWMPTGCIASFFINGKKVDTMYEQLPW